MRFFLLTGLFLISFDILGKEISYLEYSDIRSDYLPYYEKIKFNEEEQQWLYQKKRLIVATSPADISTLLSMDSSQRAHGIIADYLRIMENALNIEVILREYPNHQAALIALTENQVDTVLSPLTESIFFKTKYLLSIPFLSGTPALITTTKNSMSPMRSEKKVTITRVGDNPSKKFINENFPNADIISFGDYYHAMMAIVDSEADYFIGNVLISSSYISKYFSNSLNTIRTFREPIASSYFITNNDNLIQANIIDLFIQSVSNKNTTKLLNYWINDNSVCSINQNTSLFTSKEEDWLNKNTDLTVLVNPYLPPFTMLNENGEVKGIMGDILNIIHLRTGINFNIVEANTNEEIIQRLSVDKNSLVLAATFREERSNQIAFTDSILTTPFVFVTKIKIDEPKRKDISDGMRVGVTKSHALEDELKNRYPRIIWVDIDNSASSLQMIVDGKLDAVVTTQLTAQFMIDHYFPNELYYSRIPGFKVANIGIALPRSQIELKNLLTNILDDIPISEVSRVTEKWLKAPKIEISTWNLYRKEIFLGGVFSLILILSSLIWGVYLYRETLTRKKIQKNLENLLNEIEIEKNKALQATTAKSQFLAYMSHEIRTPINSVIGFLELLVGNTLNKQERVEALSLAYTTAQSLLGLIGEVLDVDKIESGSYQIDLDWVNVHKLVNEICRSFEPQAHSKNLYLNVISHIDTNKVAYTDAQILKQILSNILSNAIKFTDRGGVVVTAEIITNSSDKTQLNISVSDTGCGISKEEKKKLFSRYQQTESGKKQLGSGLGLLISKELIIMMSGELHLVSIIGKGTVFEIRLPIDVKCASPEQFTENSEKYSSSYTLDILIVDDHPTNIILLERQLSNPAHHVDKVGDGLKALSMVRQKKYDLVITDINMPFLNGIELTQAIRQFNKKIAIWGLTANAQENERTRCLEVGMNKCLFKPITSSTLKKYIFQLGNSLKPTGCLKYIDMSLINENASGDQNLINEIIKTFTDEVKLDIMHAKRAFEISDWVLLNQSIHRIYGSAQLFNINSITDIAVFFEDKLYEIAEHEYIKHQLDQLEEVINEVVDELNCYLYIE